jgi:hypothetical protein
MRPLHQICRLAGEDEDDKVIREMEKKLGLKKKSKSSIQKEFALDGLDCMAHNLTLVGLVPFL